MNYQYIRVSTADQSIARQEIENRHFDEIFVDHLSGKDTNRDALQRLLATVVAGDTITVHSMDRLARNLMDLRMMIEALNSKGVAVEFIKEHMTFAGAQSPMENFMLNMLGACAEFEREMIRSRCSEGIAIAKAAGKFTGGKKGRHWTWKKSQR